MASSGSLPALTPDAARLRFWYSWPKAVFQLLPFQFTAAKRILHLKRSPPRIGWKCLANWKGVCDYLMRWLFIGLLVSLGALLLAAAAAARHVLLQRKALQSMPAATGPADEADVEADI